jgi:hypothetical protein
MSNVRFARALAAIDMVNAQDPNSLTIGGVARPKELAHSEMVTDWVKRLRPDASEELLLAARAHHIRRWAVPRNSYPEGRIGYLAWRSELKKRHAAEVGSILEQCGYPPESIRRVGEIIRRIDLKGDPEAQCLEDALCLVFLETQFREIADRFDEAKVIDIVRKTLRKMSEAGKQAATTLTLDPRELEIIRKAQEQ